MRNFWEEASFLPTLNMGAGWRGRAEALAEKEKRLRLGQWSWTAGSRAADVVGRRANVRNTCEELWEIKHCLPYHKPRISQASVIATPPPVNPEGTQDGNKECPSSSSHQTAATTEGAAWRNSGFENKGYWPHSGKVHTKETQRRHWRPTPVLLPGKSHGRRSLAGSVHGVAKSRTRLSDFTFTFHFHALEKKMATHSSVLAWSIPGSGEPGRLPPTGSHRVGHDWGGLAAAAYQRKDFSEPRLLHLPIHRKALNSLTWDIWFSLISNNLLTIRLPSLCCPNFYIFWLLPSPPQSSFLRAKMLSPRLEGPKNDSWIKHNSQLLGCGLFSVDSWEGGGIPGPNLASGSQQCPCLDPAGRAHLWGRPCYKWNQRESGTPCTSTNNHPLDL